MQNRAEEHARLPPSCCRNAQRGSLQLCANRTHRTPRSIAAKIDDPVHCAGLGHALHHTSNGMLRRTAGV